MMKMSFRSLWREASQSYSDIEVKVEVREVRGGQTLSYLLRSRAALSKSY